MSRSEIPKMHRDRCGCMYSHWFENGGFGCGPSGWERDTYPSLPCDAHKAAETERRFKESERLRQEKEAFTKNELQQLEKEAAAVEEKAHNDRTRIAKRRYELMHGVDRTKVEAALAKAQQEVERLTAELNTLPPMPTD